MPQSPRRDVNWGLGARPSSVPASWQPRCECVPTLASSDRRWRATRECRDPVGSASRSKAYGAQRRAWLSCRPHRANSTSSFAARSHFAARSSASADAASCTSRSVTAFPFSRYRSSQRSAARSYLTGSFSAYRNRRRSASSSVRCPISRADASAATMLPRSIALLRIVLGCPCAVALPAGAERHGEAS